MTGAWPQQPRHRTVSNENLISAVVPPGRDLELALDRVLHAHGASHVARRSRAERYLVPPARHEPERLVERRDRVEPRERHVELARNETQIRLGEVLAQRLQILKNRDDLRRHSSRAARGSAARRARRRRPPDARAAAPARPARSTSRIVRIEPASLISLSPRICTRRSRRRT